MSINEKQGWVAEWKAKQVVKPEPLFNVIAGPGICRMSVCTNMTIEEMEQHANLHYPTGIIGYPWKLCTEKTFSGGEPNPCVCEHDATRKHYLLEC